MFGTEHASTFAATVIVLIVVPGPSVLFVVSRALAYGRRAALATVLGNNAGLALQVGLVAMGVGTLLTASAVVFTAVKLVGGAYLVYLGASAIRHRRRLASVVDAGATPRGGGRMLREGFVVGATNPKGVVIFTAVLPQFVNRDAGRVQLQLAFLGAICLLVALVTDSTWAYASSRVRGWMARSPRRLELVGGASGLAMIGLGIRLAGSGRD